MRYYAVRYSDNYLEHHGILGQKWGKKNGPPYPLGADDHSAAEKKAGWRSSINKKVSKSESKGSRSYNVRKKKGTELDSPSKLLGLSNVDEKQLKKIAKIAGVSLATAAGVMAVGYLIQQNPDLLNPKRIYDNMQIVSDVNRNGSVNTFKIDSTELLGNSGFTSIGIKASKEGYGTLPNQKALDVIMSDKNDIFSNVAKSDLVRGLTGDPSKDDAALLQLAKHERVAYVDASLFATQNTGTRRLSCWSASNAYYLSRLTGNDYISKSYENLVNFSDFKRLYKEQPKIYDLFGNSSDNFVGKFGKSFARADQNDTTALISSLFKTAESMPGSGNAGNTTIGFINAAYHSMTCTHQWNYEVVNTQGKKLLYITDCWAGERYPVASMGEGGFQTMAEGFNHFAKEMAHYNKDSVRFYAPNLESIDPKMMANVVLGKIN